MAAAEGGVPLNIDYVNLRTKEMEKGGLLTDINPLGQVSVLQLDSGEMITETSTVILWIQSQSKNPHFHIAPGSPKYFQLVRWLAFCATELHKQIFRIVFYPEATEEVKNKIRCLAPERLSLLNEHLANKPYLLGDTFSAADAYLSWFFVLAGNAKLNTSTYEHLDEYQRRVFARPLIKSLIDDDRVKDQEMDQQIIPE
jgi:glutathione S-transferase